MKKKNCKGLVFGDVHTFHPNTPTHHVVEVMYRYVLGYSKLKELDIILIEGDFFDSLIPYNHPDVHLVEKFILDLLIACSENNIVLRLLEGTPSHDMAQGINFVKIKENNEIDVDFRYVDDIEIEYIESLDMHIGYVPDEMESPLHKCYDRMVNEMTKIGIDKVDLMCMHGAFDFQFPSFYEVDSFNSKLWQALVEYFIFIGHHHDFNVLGKIIASGSLERNKHGEEKPKGLTYFEIIDGVKDYKFIINEMSRTYKTYEVTTQIDEHVLKSLGLELEALPIGARVRFSTPTRTDGNNLVEYFQRIFPQFHFTFKVQDTSKKDKAKKLVYPTFEATSEKLKIDSSNIVNLLIEEMKNDERVPNKSLKRVEELLNGVI